jgi:tetratricopeptide (TPR) repeat protein
MNKIVALIFTLFLVKSQAQTSVLNTADSLYARGNYAKAIETYKTHQPLEVVHSQIAKAYLAIGNYDEALAHYQLAVASKPQDDLLAYEYAKLLSRFNKTNEALTIFNDLSEKDKNNPNYHYEIGILLEQKSDTTAYHKFLKAYELDATHQKAIFRIARHYLVKNQNNTSLKYIEKGLESYANNVELINLKALNFYYKEDYITAAKWFEKLISLGESSQFIHEKLSFCYAQDSEYKKAIEQGELAIKYDPKNSTNLYIQGQLYERLQDFPNAEKYISMALELMDQPLDAEYTSLALIYNKQKKYKDGIESLQKALKENPSNFSAQFYLVAAKEKYYADYDSKIKVYEVFLEKYPKSPYVLFAERRLKELKEEQFMKQD